MSPATPQTRTRSTAGRGVVPPSLIEDVDADLPDATPYSHLEPEREGIVFAVACVLCSVILYGGVLLLI